MVSGLYFEILVVFSLDLGKYPCKNIIITVHVDLISLRISVQWRHRKLMWIQNLID